MPNQFDSIEWHAAVGRIISAADDQAAADALIEAVNLVALHNGTCLIAFHQDAPPEVLHHTMRPDVAAHYLDRYLSGPYLLDPLYQLAISERKPAICRFRDQLPDRFRSSEYYHQYCEQTHLLDEMDYLADVDEGTTIALVIGRRQRMFSKAELQRLQVILPTVQAAIREIWRKWRRAKRGGRRNVSVHRKLIRCFNSFGAASLTDRERQICQLLLRGHSSKSVARELDIAPGTVMVHKRNVFAKLGIRSQYELFSMFIDELGAR